MALQVLANTMANVPGRKRVFIKLQSANTPVIDLYREVSAGKRDGQDDAAPLWQRSWHPRFRHPQAFPSVPFIFLYRDPVEVLVSHFFHGPKMYVERGAHVTLCGVPFCLVRAKSVLAYPHPAPHWLYQFSASTGSKVPPCARSARSPPPDVKALIKRSSGGSERPSTEQYCAAYLANLCAQALKAIDSSVRRWTGAWGA